MLTSFLPGFFVSLTLIVAMRLGYLRWSAVAKREVDIRYFKSYDSFDEPENLRITSRHLINLLEMPMLFYVVCILVYVTGQSSALLVSLAWAYVAARLVHTFIHLGSNVVLWRFRIFGLSILILATMWIVMLIQLVRI